MTVSVLMIGNFLSASTGTRSVCEDLAIELRRAGWTVVTASSQRRRLPRLLDMLSTAWRRRGQYEVAQVDVFSGPAFFWAEAVCWILRKACKPYVLTLHGGNLPAFGSRSPGRVRRLLSSAAAVTTPSAYLMQRMRPYREDLFLAPNPLDLAVFEYQARRTLEPRLIWVRAFHRLYNPMLAPRVLALLVNDFAGIRLTMIGPDKGDGSLEETRELARKLGVGDCIDFAGAADRREIPELLNRHDIFLNTTNADNTPVSVMEAMACGLCVVSTDVGGMPSLLAPGHEAMLTPADDERSMAAAIARLLTQPELAEALSRNARRKVEQFDWTAVLPKWESLLESAARRGSAS